MSCHCCGNFLGKTEGTYGRQTFVLMDQNFPTALPSDGRGLKCLKIVRIEGGGLNELADMFIEMTRSWVLPAGCLVLLGSQSHLSAVGLSAYIEDLCAAVEKLAIHFRRTINIVPAPFILCEDTADAHLIRAIVELYAWISSCLKHVEGVSLAAFQISLEGINYCGKGEVQPDHEARYRLPDNLDNRNKQLWTSTGLGALPTGVGKFSEEVETEIVLKLIADLNSLLALDLLPVPCFDRKAERCDMEPIDNTNYILVGGSNALRTANGLARAGKKAFAATIPGWRPTAALLGPLLKKIERALELCKTTVNTVLVYQLHDNCFYFGRGEDGSLLPATKGKDDKFHVLGASVLAPKELQYMAFKQTLPILEAGGNIRKIVLGPLPRYWVKPCCADRKHCSNMADVDYQKTLESAIYESKGNLKAFCFRHGLREIRIVSSWQLLKNEDNLWSEDPVHMCNAGYDILAANIISTAEELKKKRVASEAAGNPNKKTRFDTDSRQQPSAHPLPHRGSHQADRRDGRALPHRGSYQADRRDGRALAHSTNSWQGQSHPQFYWAGEGLGNRGRRDRRPY